MLLRNRIFHVAALLSVLLTLQAACADSLATNFVKPPASARPWVYWFWNNANVTKAGITADLEAMKRAGIGGVIIMDVVERFAPPRGTAEFMNAEWRELFCFAVAEAKRLGIEINLTNGPGWCGSSGPWITPELSMQMLVSTNVLVAGPTNFSGVLPVPGTGNKQRHDGFDSSVKYDDFYRDIAVLAFPETTNGAVPRESVLKLTTKLNAKGTLNWQVPPGNWLIERIGHTTTGSSTRPPVVGGNGLECDKLSREAMDVHFKNMIGRLLAQVGSEKRGAFVATHIDSWEVGSQNWTPKLREEFLKRRGYDPIPFLPCVTEKLSEKANGKTSTSFLSNVGDQAMADRFRWDFNQTISELLAENYSGRLAELAHKHGLRLSIEGYDLPFGDEATYTARADEPMSEFWTGNGTWSANLTLRKSKQMASVGHVMGRTIIGAESFTSGDQEKWMLHPALIKSLGDLEFCQGINRFVIHRYAHQPYLDRAPGATMGPWGLHYERTQTWWEMSAAWHDYLARCQFMLRQGKYVAELCYLRPEIPHQTYFTPNPPPPAGYRYDEISAENLIQHMSVKNGKLVLPDGMSYRVLVLPPEKAMTPALAAKIQKLLRAGAMMVATAARPDGSPSLQNFPKCDQVVARLGREIWGDCDGRTVTAHPLGKGKLFWGQPLAKILVDLSAPPDFISDVALNWIHRRADGAEIYFVANPENVAVEARCTFRVAGLRPELWNPETGVISPLAAWDQSKAGVTVPLRLEPSGSVFIVFRQRAAGFDPVVSLRRNGQTVPEPLPAPPGLKIMQATYGVPGDAARTRDVSAQVQALVDGGRTTFQVAELAEAGDPAYGVVKTFSAEYLVGGKICKATGQDPNVIQLQSPISASERPAEIVCDATGRLQLLAREPGRYEWITASDKTNCAEVLAVPPPVEIGGPWQLSFPPKWGAPESVRLTNLISWTEYQDDGVKYFSGTATYRTTFDMPQPATGNRQSKMLLELGDVQVMARVRLNGHDCGIAWKPPFRVEVTGALREGENDLDIQVANLWPNRMIGDAALAKTNRFTWSSWQPFKSDTALLKSGLLGPVRLLVTTPAREVIPAKPAGRLVDTNTMSEIFDEVKTPFKYGVVIKGASANELVDCPSIFCSGGRWYMMFVAITNKIGYQTFLARSDDLLHWQKLGRILSFTPTNNWDAWQADGGIALCDYRWDGSHELEKFDGKYWLSYIGGAKQGYETDPLSLGMAWTKNPTKAMEWNRVSENPILSGRDAAAREFEKKTLYKSQIIHDASESLGYPFVMYYNGKKKNGFERIGMAVSRDMIHWNRYGENPVVANGEAKTNGISGDPQIVKIGDVWTMFYFGAGWGPKAFDTFACSYDLVHWTKWDGANLIEPSEPFDKTYAHKPWLLKWNGVVYHFYCAVGDQGRVIALATSRDLK